MPKTINTGAKYRAREVMGEREEPIDVVFLNGHAIKFIYIGDSYNLVH